ncbi:uncharacterized protein PV07_10689 [Cladophialophora immunda]|uniref:NTF2-like domain-containing protein n=1 Tax=Cladophialophora immunda TaxID=569365 RepID=A0A0D2C168_9EURO|nr:uncharacterized protein PV07_10689 [Cladophialophora immunda]KIW25013.1 hypothetical protein PV07_10689 [Cladophialophora immunda]
MRFTILTLLTIAASALGQEGGPRFPMNRTHGVNHGANHEGHGNHPRGEGQRTWGYAPSGHPHGPPAFVKGMPVGKGCLNSTSVDYLVKGYTYLLQYPGGADFNETADDILSDKFAVWSDSINTLGNRTLGTPAYPSLQAFIASQAVTPPLPTVGTLSTSYTCDQIFWRWNATGIGKDAMRVQGMILFDVDVAAVQIDTVYSEFNTAAFWVDLGNPECQASK